MKKKKNYFPSSKTDFQKGYKKHHKNTLYVYCKSSSLLKPYNHLKQIESLCTGMGSHLGHDWIGYHEMLSQYKKHPTLFHSKPFCCFWKLGYVDGKMQKYPSFRKTPHHNITKHNSTCAVYLLEASSWKPQDDRSPAARLLNESNNLTSFAKICHEECRLRL